MQLFPDFEHYSAINKVSYVQERRTGISLIPTGLAHTCLYLQMLGKQSLARLANPQNARLSQREKGMRDFDSLVL